MDRILEIKARGRSIAYSPQYFVNAKYADSLEDVKIAESNIKAFAHREEIVQLIENGETYRCNHQTNDFLRRGGFRKYFEDLKKSIEVEADRKDLEFKVLLKDSELKEKQIRFFKYRVLWISLSAICGGIITYILNLLKQ